MAKVISRKRAFSGLVTNIDQVELQFKNGQQRTFELVEYNVETGVSALPIQHDQVVLIKHYQAGKDALGYSLPTGGLEKGEDPKERMQLELQEEIGYKAGNLTLMAQFDILPSYIGSKPGFLYLAKNLTPSVLEGDEPYAIEIIKMDLEKALNLVQSGEIQDSRVALALLYYQQFYT